MRDLKGCSLVEFPESYVVLDVETTGFDPSKDCLIEVAALKIDNNEITDSFCSFIKPEVAISPFIAQLTGITEEMLDGAPEPKYVLPLLKDFINDYIIVGHNVNFDINFLYDNFTKHMGIPFSNDYVDTLRLSKRYYKTAPSYKLVELAKFLSISVTSSHRALADCHTTNSLLLLLKEAAERPTDTESDLLSTLTFDDTNPFYKKRIAVKGLPQYYSFSFMREVAKKCHAELNDVFYSSCDYIVFSQHTYNRYKKGEYSIKFEKADQLVKEGTLIILSEEEWCNLLQLPIPAHVKPSHVKNGKISSKDISAERTEFDTTHPLYGKVCVFTGTLEKMARKDAMQLVANFGGIIGDSVTKKTNYLVLGNNDYCPSVKDGKSSKQKKAESLKLSGQDIEIISENVFYDMTEE